MRHGNQYFFRFPTMFPILSVINILYHVSQIWIIVCQSKKKTF